MISEIIEILIGVPVVAGLVLLVPRRAARAWAVWLLICLIVLSIQGMGLGVFSHYDADEMVLFTNDNELEFLKNQAGELVGVAISDPPKGFTASHLGELPVILAGNSLLFACAILLLLLRAESAEPSAPTAGRGSGRGTGISLLAFGLVLLLASTVEAIVGHRDEGNLIGVAVIASGFYVARGSMLAAKWAFALMALIGFFSVLLVALMASGKHVLALQPGQAPWAITIGLAVTAWAATNLFLICRLITRSDNSAEPADTTDGGGTGS
jgi:hypothetical protein